MSRIEANVATQLADVSRPQQTRKDQVERQADTVSDRNKGGEEQSPLAVQAEDVRSAAEQMKQVVEAASGRNLAFDIFEDTKQLFVRIRDQDSGEEIKQIPAEEVLELQARVQEILGLFVDEKV
jgi:flagellar protein FlaG